MSFKFKRGDVIQDYGSSSCIFERAIGAIVYVNFRVAEVVWLVGGTPGKTTVHVHAVFNDDKKIGELSLLERIIFGVE